MDLLLLLIILLLAPNSSSADNKTTTTNNNNNLILPNNNNNSNNSTVIITPTPSPQTTPFKPSVAVIVAVLTTVFSITFLLLLYAKHCRRVGDTSDSHAPGPGRVSKRNSGVDRAVIESLPVFRFGALRGEKGGTLECAVCLNRFEPDEVLRLLPKCKHGFHVECVDTWLDAHSTCPLCRYRVEPEDILLLSNNDCRIPGLTDPNPPPIPPETNLRRVSGRHSSAGERQTGGGGYLRIVVEKPETTGDRNCLPARRSFDGWSNRKKKRERNDDVLLEAKLSQNRLRLEHRIVIDVDERWSDVQPSDLLYLRSEMILSDSRRISGSRPSVTRHSNNGSGRSVINGRSVSEITGLRRYEKETTSFSNHRGKSLISRWLAWVSQPQLHTQQQH